MTVSRPPEIVLALEEGPLPIRLSLGMKDAMVWPWRKTYVEERGRVSGYQFGCSGG